jgi:integrase/recombinase XerD
MKTPKKHQTGKSNQPQINQVVKRARGTGDRSPLDYDHPYPSMADFAARLVLGYGNERTSASYYRDMRLIHEHVSCDPALITEPQLRDYFLYVKTVKQWKPKTIRQTLASSKIFFVTQLGHTDWTVFSQVRTKDHGELPPVLSRQQVHDLLCHIRLRRYRTPIKLIYCCGLRLSECLNLTIHDIRGDENKLWVRNGKGKQDRMVPIPTPMVEDLRAYYRFHRHPLFLFPNVGRGTRAPDKMRLRMKQAQEPIPMSSLQRLMVVARKELNLPDATVHTLRHSYATHLLELGASLHNIQHLLGHKQINSTMVYLHLTHHRQQDTLRLAHKLCLGLPR